jgi:hypothetical protein
MNRPMAKQQAHREQCPITGGRGSNGGQRAPDREGNRQRIFRAVAINQPARRYLQHGIGPEEGGIQQPALGIVDLEEILEVAVDDRKRQVDPVDIGNDTGQRQKNDDPPAAIITVHSGLRRILQRGAHA